MLMRLTYFKAKPDQIAEMKVAYRKTAALIKREPGNVDCFLMEPLDSAEWVSCTLWKTRRDGERYDKSGTYAARVAGMKSFLVGKTRLKSYAVAKR